MYIFKVTYKEYIDGKKYKNEVDIVLPILLKLLKR